MPAPELSTTVNLRGRLTTVAAPALILIALVSATAWAVSGVAGYGGAVAPDASAREGQEQAVYKQSLRVWVHDDGLRPDLLHVAPGAVVLRATNASKVDVALVVERVAQGRPAQRVARVTATPRRRGGHQELTLGEGEYAYYEESRPQYRGKLVVEPRRQ